MEGLSLHYLSRYLSNQLGVSFQDYLTMLRYRRARLLLGRTDMKPTDIAYSSGFSDIRYLNQVFLETHGCLPQEYRLRFSLEDAQISPDDDEGAVQRFLDDQESKTYLRQWLEAHPDYLRE
jgi:AraC-like DNA-binding protein